MLVTCQVTVYRSLTHTPLLVATTSPPLTSGPCGEMGGVRRSLMHDGTAEGSIVGGEGLYIHACSTLSSVSPGDTMLSK